MLEGAASSASECSSRLQAHSIANTKYCNEWLLDRNTQIANGEETCASVEDDLVGASGLDSAYEYAPDVWGSEWDSHARRPFLAFGASRPGSGSHCLTTGTSPLSRQHSLDVALDAVTVAFLREAALQQLPSRQHVHRGHRRSLDVMLDEAGMPDSDAATWSSSNRDDGGTAVGESVAAAATLRNSARSSLDLLLDRAEVPQQLAAAAPLPLSSLSPPHMTRSSSSRDVASEVRQQQQHQQMLLGSRRGAYVSLESLMEHGESS